MFIEITIHKNQTKKRMCSVDDITIGIVVKYLDLVPEPTARDFVDQCRCECGIVGTSWCR